MNKVLMRLCATALSLLCFCGSGVFAMFSTQQKICFPSTPFYYNDRLVRLIGYPYIIEKTDIERMDPVVVRHWNKFWWSRRAMQDKRFNLDTYIKISRAYTLTAEIQIRKRTTENGRSEKWERVNRALRDSADWVFHAFLADYFYDFYKKDCHKRFSPGCIWAILNEMNSSFVKKRISEKTGEELSTDEDLYKEFEKVPVGEKDIDDCFFSLRGRLPTPACPYTEDVLNAVQFVSEGLYYMEFDSLVVFFSTLYAYFFDHRTRYFPEQIYIIHTCIENLYNNLVTNCLSKHKIKRPEWFTSSQYLQLLRLIDGCNPDSYAFASEASGVMSRLKDLGL